VAVLADTPLQMLFSSAVTDSTGPNRPFNLVALLAILAAIILFGIELWVVDISSTPDSPIIGALLGVLPALLAVCLVYPIVSWFYVRGVRWRSETGDVSGQVTELQNQIGLLREEVATIARRIDA
jgi:hypothetical protein